MPKLQHDHDPRPEPPVQPELEDCCNSGCDPCVFDTYYAAMDRYRKELSEWEQRHANVQGGKGKP